MIKRFISLLLLSVCLGDTLILIDKTVYTGTLIKFENNKIIFRALPSAKLSVDLSDIQKLKLSDGSKIIENGIIVAANKEKIKSTSYDRFLSISKTEKAKRRPEDRKRIINFCCITAITFGLLIYSTFKIDLGWPEGPWPGDGHS